MSWGRIDDGLYDHPKLDALGSSRLVCVGLYTLALSWSNRYLTDGFIPAPRVQRLGGTIPLAEKLVEATLWERAGDDYRIHDFHDFNDTAQEVRERQQNYRELGRRGGLATAANRRQRDATATDTPGATADAAPSRSQPRPLPSIPTVPVPNRTADHDRFDEGYERTMDEVRPRQVEPPSDAEATKRLGSLKAALADKGYRP